MSEFYGLLGSEIKHRKGEVISYIGDGVLGIFRREASAGMDPEWCAALAAFHLKKELKKVNSDLELNIGIHSGEVIEGRWEEQGRLMHSVFGDVVNRCALMGGGKLKGIHVTKAISEILGPRVSREKVSIRFPGCNEEEMVYKLTSLVL